MKSSTSYSLFASDLRSGFVGPRRPFQDSHSGIFWVSLFLPNYKPFTHAQLRSLQLGLIKQLLGDDEDEGRRGNLYFCLINNLPAVQESCSRVYWSTVKALRELYYANKPQIKFGLFERLALFHLRFVALNANVKQLRTQDCFSSCWCRLS